jgi:hypothetical protein
MAQPVSYPIDTKGFIPRGKTTEIEADHPPPYSAQVKKSGALWAQR